MMLTALIRDERGFTLQETVVVMIVGSFLVGFSYTLFGFVMHFLHTNLETREHHETLQHVAAAICTDIERSEYVNVSDTCLVLERAQRSPITYRCVNGKIVRNGSVITPPDSSIWSVQWHEIDDTTSGVMPPVALEITALWKRNVDSISCLSRVPWSSQGAFSLGARGPRCLSE
jgi:hypothetical protein